MRKKPRVHKIHNVIHGHSYSPEYYSWQMAKDRCHNPKNKYFKGYGQRGIVMAEEWRNDFPAFLKHIGPRPSSEMSLDRIDNDKGYIPGNVRWADRVTQQANRRISAAYIAKHKAMFDLYVAGKTQKQISELYNIQPSSVSYALKAHKKLNNITTVFKNRKSGIKRKSRKKPINS